MLNDRYWLANLARARGLSVRQLERRFQEQFAVCPREVIHQFRMALASRRLLSGAPMKQIAFDLSFYDAASFSKAVRHYYGMSRLQMRRGLIEVSRRANLDVAVSQRNVAFSQAPALPRGAPPSKISSLIKDGVRREAE